MNTFGLPTIYVVDDEKLISETLSIILRDRGFAAQAFTSPEDVVKRCAEELPDVLLSDITMPGMTGVELARTVRAICPSCIVVFFSAEPLLLAAIADRVEIEQPFACLNKPLHPETLLQTIRFLTALTPTKRGHPQVVVTL